MELSREEVVGEVVEAIAQYCDELGVKTYIDESGPAVWLGDVLRAGGWHHRIGQKTYASKEAVEDVRRKL